MGAEVPGSPGSPGSAVGPRRIVHVAVDAFYAAVEQRDRLELRGRPVLVAAPETDGRAPPGGLVASVSVEALRYGPRPGWDLSKARRACPDAQVLPADMERYGQVAAQVHAALVGDARRVEPLALGEAYLDMTADLCGEGSFRNAGLWVKERIGHEVGLTASVGVAPCKFVARVAGQLRRPDGLTVVEPEEVLDFVGRLPVERIEGVGPKTGRLLRHMGLNTAADVRRIPAGLLRQALGSAGAFIHALAHGDDPRPVIADRGPGFRRAAAAFGDELLDIDVLLRVTGRLSRKVDAELRRTGLPGRTVAVELRYAGGDVVTRTVVLESAVSGGDDVAGRVEALLRSDTDAGRRPVAAVAVSLGGLPAPQAPRQLALDTPLVRDGAGRPRIRRRGGVRTASAPAASGPSGSGVPAPGAPAARTAAAQLDLFRGGDAAAQGGR